MATNKSSSLTTPSQHATSYLQSLGWTKAQASGLVGNFQQESGTNLKIDAYGDSGKAYGIAQWHPDRQANFQQQYGFPIQQASLEQQLDFVNYELTQGNEKAAGAALKATTDAGQAAVVVATKYERAGTPNTSQRVAYANTLYQGAPTVAPGGLSQEEKDKISGKPPGTTGETSTQSEPVMDPVTGKYNFYNLPGGQSSAGNTPLAENPDSVDTTHPLPNVLQQYPSYTYGLSLHLLSANEYNAVVGSGNYTPKRVLVSSAGRYNNTPGPNQFIRSPYFAEDFYFDDFSLTTVIGTNSNSRNTNAIEMSFTLLEPYGMTLINRLLDQANDPEMQCSNYLDMVYLVQIDFFANNDAGEVVGLVPGITKRFPIKLTQMNIKASVRGSEYQIQAVPYNHSAFDQTTISVPANFEIVAGSVGEFFQAGTNTNPQSQITSLPNALNGWQQDLAKNNKIGVPDTYAFNIDPKISGALFASAATMSPRDTSMSNPTNTNSIRQSNTGQATKDYNPQTRTFSINAGTSIDKVVDYAVRNSDYIKNQIVIPDGVDPQTYLQQKAQTANQPLNWYKITPTVTLGDFDPIRNVNSRNITYNVTPYVIYNVKSDVAPQGKIKNFVKTYSYIYTGKNDDVIDFEINFNTLYYTAQTAFRSAVAKIYRPSKDSNATASQNSDSYQGQNQNPNSVMPMVMKPQVYNARARATGGSVNAKDAAIADLEDSLMTLSAADMLSVNLKILGDPQFIKQDDCFYSPTATNTIATNDPRLTGNGSLRTDYSEIYVLLTFRTPVDVDENTGLMRFANNYRTSVFSGIYKVLTVTSEFKNGLFSQTLNLIRLPNQSNYDYVNQPQSSSSQRLSDLNPTTTAALSANPVIPSILKSPSIPTIGEASSQRSAQKQLEGTQNEESLVSPEQQQLINLNNNNEQAVPITDANQPVLIPPILLGQ